MNKIKRSKTEVSGKYLSLTEGAAQAVEQTATQPAKILLGIDKEERTATAERLIYATEIVAYAFSRRRVEAVVMGVVEPKLGEEYVPAIQFVTGKRGGGYALALQCALHAEVGLHVEEAAFGNGGGCASVVLAVVIDTGTEADFPAVKIVEARGVVVAVEGQRVVVGIAEMEVTPHKVEPVERPVERERESFEARVGRWLGQGCGGRRRGIVLETFVGLPVEDEAEKHAVRMRMVVEDGHGVAQGIGRKAVVGIDHADVAPPCVAEGQVAGDGLPLVAVVAEDAQAVVAASMVEEYVEGAVGGGVVDGEYLDFPQRLPEQGAESLVEPRLGVIYGHEYGDEGRGHGRRVFRKRESKGGSSAENFRTVKRRERRKMAVPKR